MKIAIISASVRDGRLSHRVALFVQGYLNEQGFKTDMLDLLEFNFPLFSERYAMQKSRSEAVEEFTRRFNSADAVWIVSPIYNSSYPASLKNVVDLYFKEWQRKPVALSVVSGGGVAPLTAVEKLQSLLYKMGARVATAPHTVINVGADFSENGVPTDTTAAENFLAPTFKELKLLMRIKG